MKTFGQPNSVSGHVSQLVLVLIGATVLNGCGAGFEKASTASTTPTTTSGNGNNAQGVDPVAANNTFKDLQVEGTVSGGTYGDNSVIGIDKTTKELIVTFPVLTTPVLDSGIASIPIPDIPGARLTMEPTANGGQTLALRIPLDKVIRGVALLPPSKLPNGDPLPAVADGELPSAAVQFPISRTKVTVYLAPTEVCLYVDSPFDPFVSLTLPIRNQARTKTWGYFSTIPAKSNSVKGGFFVSIKLPDDVARAIDNVL